MSDAIKIQLDRVLGALVYVMLCLEELDQMIFEVPYKLVFCDSMIQHLQKITLTCFKHFPFPKIKVYPNLGTGDSKIFLPKVTVFTNFILFVCMWLKRKACFFVWIQAPCMRKSQSGSPMFTLQCLRVETSSLLWTNCYFLHCKVQTHLYSWKRKLFYWYPFRDKLKEEDLRGLVRKKIIQPPGHYWEYARMLQLFCLAFDTAVQKDLPLPPWIILVFLPQAKYLY